MHVWGGGGGSAQKWGCWVGIASGVIHSDRKFKPRLRSEEQYVEYAYP